MTIRDILASVTTRCDACSAAAGEPCDPFCVGVAAVRDEQEEQTVEMVRCPRCEGHCEQVYEPPGWWNGSGVFAESYPCSLCEETGEVPAGTVDTNDYERGGL